MFDISDWLWVSLLNFREDQLSMFEIWLQNYFKIENFRMHVIIELTTMLYTTIIGMYLRINKQTIHRWPQSHSFNTFIGQLIVIQTQFKLSTGNMFGKVLWSWETERNGVSTIWRYRKWYERVGFEKYVQEMHSKYCIGTAQPWNTGLQQKSIGRDNNKILCDRPLMTWSFMTIMMIRINMEGQKHIVVMQNFTITSWNSFPKIQIQSKSNPIIWDTW